jgi:hypothetical protein
LLAGQVIERVLEALAFARWINTGALGSNWLKQAVVNQLPE